MADAKPRLARLTAIITQLQSKRIVTARAIAEKHNVSVRTIYRDIKTLERSGIPIVTEEGKGYSIMEGYKLPPVMFTEEEANALVMAEHLIRQNKDQSLAEHYERAITKIKSILKFNQIAKTDLLASRIQVRDNRENQKSSNYLIQLQSMITNFQAAKLDYYSLSDQTSQRVIEPFALYTTQGNWILVAHCRKRAAFRAFRLDRIQRLQALNDYFSPHELSLEQYLESCRTNFRNHP